MNRLKNETSLYLQQHADNPVDWWPWDETALAEAKRRRKPILLSIGYSACHWCHVMAHESFEDETIAALMNERFVNIKVDREQRPDLDKIYQTAHQLMTQRAGGWPLTMFLTPDAQLPFFGGTYFPPEARHGMPAFTEVLSKVADFHDDNPEEAARQGGAVQAVFEKLEPAPDEQSVGTAPIAALREHLATHFDETNGGFGTAPKFPQIQSLQRLLNHWRNSANSDEPDLQALYIAALSQTRMASGGLFDQIGGGFFRYCVDQRWQVPHFEKMLYDNAQLLALYANSWQATGDVLFRDTANATADWLLREMRADNGGFFATIDADTTAGEGMFYVWTLDEIRAALDDEQFAIAYDYFGLDQPANFEGRWHLQATQTVEALSESLQRSEPEINAQLTAIRTALLDRRNQRPRPATDQKILTGWNALTIKGLAIASRALQDPRLLEAAADCVDFVRRELIRENRLLACWQDGTATLSAYLDDYAYLIDALLELLQCEWRDDWLVLARTLADTMLADFEDRDAGAFYFTANHHEALMYRQKPISDDATPAGNASALRVLTRLGHLLADERYLNAAQRIVDFAGSALKEAPQAHASMIDALADTLAPIETLVLRGDAELLEQWRQSVQTVYAPSRMTFAIPDSDSLPAALASHRAPNSGALAYLCRGTQCLAPIDNWRALAAEIRNH